MLARKNIIAAESIIIKTRSTKSQEYEIATLKLSKIKEKRE
jgi:hypothetical protein